MRPITVMDVSGGRGFTLHSNESTTDEWQENVQTGTMTADAVLCVFRIIAFASHWRTILSLSFPSRCFGAALPISMVHLFLRSNRSFV